MPDRKTVGAWGEAVAVKRLELNGFAIRARNWRPRAVSGTSHGELDIVAERAGVIHFVEVRTRRSQRYGAPGETLGARKRAKLLITAQAYLAEHHLEDCNWCIDAILIEMDQRNQIQHYDHIERAIEA